ncbi:MAG: helix-hairpin-helix domain-containing protein [Sedimenticola sp.]
MSDKEQVEALVRVRKIRNKTDFAVTLVAVELDQKHNVLDHSRYIVISIPKYNTNTTIFYPNEVWRFVGKPDTRTITTDSYIGIENVIEVESATLICESGDNFVTEVWKSDEYVGIGETLARRLWESFGDSIYDLLDNGAKAPLLSILQEDVAANLVHVWNKKGLSKQIRWIELMGIPSEVGIRCVNYYLSNTISKLEANPYALLPFSAKWDTIDEIARDKFRIAEDDHRRIFAAVEHSVHLGVARSRNHHTAFTVLNCTQN